MDWTQILDLPQSCQVEMPITKVSLKNHNQIILSERRLLDDAAIQQMKIIGAVSKRSANIEPDRKSVV